MKEYAWINELKAIISDYKDGSEEALNGDETERLAYILLQKMDLNEGNITEIEYENNLDVGKSNKKDRFEIYPTTEKQEIELEQFLERSGLDWEFKLEGEV